MLGLSIFFLIMAALSAVPVVSESGVAIALFAKVCLSLFLLLSVVSMTRYWIMARQKPGTEDQESGHESGIPT